MRPKLFRLPGLEELKSRRASVWSLLAANLIPLVGVVAWGWSTFAIVAIYWAENVVIGAINLLKMLCCATDMSSLAGSENEQYRQLASRGAQAAKLFVMPFFTVHYGMFCFVHGVFVFTLLGGGMDGVGSPLDVMRSMFHELVQGNMLWAIGGLAASHLVSFVINYLGRGEFRRTNLVVLMFQPYGRVVVLHVAILFGGIVAQFLGSPVFLLLLLIGGKTLLDLGLHLAEHAADSTSEVVKGD